MNDDREPPVAASILRGLVYTHTRANANTGEVHETAATLAAVVELLVEQGLIDREALAERRQNAGEALRRRYIERGMAVAMQEFDVSKYAFEGGAVIDCEQRVHLCKAACCKLPLALSSEDVREGIVRWELGQPYMIEHGADGYCVHLERGTCRCTIHAQRPIPCRGYDCRQDARIWLDFENKVINPKIDEPDWPDCLEEEEAEAATEGARLSGHAPTKVRQCGTDRSGPRADRCAPQLPTPARVATVTG